MIESPETPRVVAAGPTSLTLGRATHTGRFTTQTIDDFRAAPANSNGRRGR